MNRPHIILLILDSTRSDFLGCYGSDLGLTPNIDALAENGFVFQNHYAASCGSAASHVSIFTGQHPARHRMYHNLCEIRNDLQPLPAILRPLRYKAFSHCTMSFVPPVGYADLFGFDEILSPGNMGAHGNRSLAARVMNIARSFTPAYIMLKRLYRTFASPERQIRTSARMQDGMPSIRYILERLRQNAASGPVFAYSTILHPHLPCCAPKPFLDKVFNGQRQHPDAFRIQLNVHGFANGDFGLAAEAIDSLRKLYMADLMYADHLVGVLARGMREMGILEDSIIVVTSDHGELLGEHGCINHGAMVWEELFRTPCVIHASSLIGSGVVSALTSGMDITPTLLEILGARVPDGLQIDGINALAQSGGARSLVVDSPPAVLPGRYRRFPRLLKMVNVIRRAIRTEEWKYVWQSDGDHKLYDMRSDRREEHNLYATIPQKTERLHADMCAFYRGIAKNFKIDEYPVPISPNVRERITDETVRAELAREGYA